MVLVAVRALLLTWCFFVPTPCAQFPEVQSTQDSGRDDVNPCSMMGSEKVQSTCKTVLKHKDQISELLSFLGKLIGAVTGVCVGCAGFFLLIRRICCPSRDIWVGAVDDRAALIFGDQGEVVKVSQDFAYQLPNQAKYSRATLTQVDGANATGWVHPQNQIIFKVEQPPLIHTTTVAELRKQQREGRVMPGGELQNHCNSKTS